MSVPSLSQSECCQPARVDPRHQPILPSCTITKMGWKQEILVVIGSLALTFFKAGLTNPQEMGNFLERVWVGHQVGMVVTRWKKTGTCAQGAGRMSEVEILLKRALDLQTAAFGPDDLGVADILKLLGGCLQDAGRLREVEEWYKRALDIETTKLGPDDLSVAHTLVMLGTCVGLVGNQERVGEMEEFLKRALDIQTTKLG
ncbi:unnamed protein product, partial [Ectocarpus fasciculatus]